MNWNHSSNGNFIHIKKIQIFPILVETPLIFPILWALAPFPKRGVRALGHPLISESCCPMLLRDLTGWDFYIESLCLN